MQARLRPALLLSSVVCLGLAVTPGCEGKKVDGGDKTAGGESAPAAKGEDTESGKGLGQAVTRIYVDTFDAVVGALEAKPPVEEAKAKVAPLLDAAKKQLVAIGHKREELDAGERSAFDREVGRAFSKVPKERFAAFSALVKHYRKPDNAFANELAGLNILTQYAAFELLKKQAPKEAEKYGVK